MLAALRRPNRPRRGVTLVEMLVVVALVVLMMVILVQIFQSALGAMSASRTTQELDVVLRTIDSTLRADLAGVTAKMTPPNDPALKQGYFEYGENAPADLQGEDTDDFLAFTTKAREGQVFTGRQFLTGSNSGGGTVNLGIQPITITSQVAEVIYFLRNGNLYRRVFLVVPDRAKSLTIGSLNGGGRPTSAFGSPSSITSIFASSGGQLNVSWLGQNDISARPGGFDGNGIPLKPIPNDLGDLTNRENRAFRPRFINDFQPPYGVPDDANADGVPDYYPTLYYDGNGYNPPSGNSTIGWAPNTQVLESVSYYNNAANPSNLVRVEQKTLNSYDVYAFPFIFPGMYSMPDPYRMNNALGWVHYLKPNSGGYINHAPLDIGETSLLVPPSGSNQTWWGFPTWRETLAGLISANRVGWADPVTFVGTTGNVQPLGLRPFPPTLPPSTYNSAQFNNANLLPPVYAPGTANPPPFFDGAGSPTFVTVPFALGSNQPANPNPIWEDDLILTNVRSFDVKAYDPDAAGFNVLNNNNSGGYAIGPFGAGYQDLGYGAYKNDGTNGYLVGLAGTGSYVPVTNANAFQTTGIPVGFGHEGRIPPIPQDFRVNPSRPTYVDTNGNLQSNYVGDVQAGVIRLVRTFDTWSTAYTNAPSSDIQLNGYSSSARPIYPSFPPPYPSPLRGIQIQIRVVDPRNERSKVLTIRHDFTDKLTN